jgi:hypothetical protein
VTEVAHILVGGVEVAQNVVRENFGGVGCEDPVCLKVKRLWCFGGWGWRGIVRWVSDKFTQAMKKTGNEKGKQKWHNKQIDHGFQIILKTKRLFT